MPAAALTLPKQPVRKTLENGCAPRPLNIVKKVHEDLSHSQKGGTVSKSKLNNGRLNGCLPAKTPLARSASNGTARADKNVRIPRIVAAEPKKVQQSLSLPAGNLTSKVGDPIISGNVVEPWSVVNGIEDKITQNKVGALVKSEPVNGTSDDAGDCTVGRIVKYPLRRERSSSHNSSSLPKFQGKQTGGTRKGPSVSGCWQTTTKSRDDGHIPVKPELKSVIKITSETQERTSKSDLQSPLISPPRMSNSCDNLSTVIAVNYVPNSSSSAAEKTALAPPADSSSAADAVTFSPTVIPINYSDASSPEQLQPPVPPRKICFNGKSSVWGKLRARSLSQPSLTNEALNINVRHEESAPPLPPRPSLSAIQNKTLSRAVSAVSINDLPFGHIRYGNHLPSRIPRRLPSPNPPFFGEHPVNARNGDIQAKNNNRKDIGVCGKSDLQCVLQKYEELEKECEDLVSHAGKKLADKHTVSTSKPNHNRSASEVNKRIHSEVGLSNKSSPRNVCLVPNPDKKIVRSKSVDRCKNTVFSGTHRSRSDVQSPSPPEKSHIQDRNHKTMNVQSNSPLAKTSCGVVIKSTLKRDFFSTESLNNKTEKTQAIHPKSDVVLTQKNVTDDCKNVNVKQLVLKNEKLGNKMTVSTSLNTNEDNGDSKCNGNDDKANVGNVFRHLRSLSSESQKSLYGLIHLYHSGGYWTGFPKLSKEEVDPFFKNTENHSKIIEDVKQRKVEKNKNQKTDYSNILMPGGGIGVVRAYTGRQISDSRYRTELEIFFRSGVLAQLEAQRDERLTDHVVRLQAQCRGYLARRKLHKLKIQDLAVRCIQRNVRKFLLIRDWPWWRLLVRVTPLLNVHRTEEELRAKTEELEALRAKVEKLEQERTHLKHDTDRLEAKVSAHCHDASRIVDTLK